MRTSLPSTVLESPSRFALLLNARARKWSGELHEELQRWVPSQDMYLSDDFHQAERNVDRVLEKDYSVVFTGGGDGTIAWLINAFRKRVREGKRKADELPIVGVLRLGTGNALSHFLQAGVPVDDLRRMRQGASLSVYDLMFVEDEDQDAFPFAGFGWDARIINDYDDFKKSVRDTAFERFATGMTGYAASVLGRSIPAEVRNQATHAVITNKGSAIEIDEIGRELKIFDEDEIIFDGPIKTLGPSSIPYWGFRIRMFPFATREPGHFQMRVFNGSISGVLLHLPSWWEGKLEEGTVRDFLCDNVHVKLSKPMAYQRSGDSAGLRDEVQWRATEKIRVGVVI